MGCICVCAAGAGALDGVAAVALMAVGFAVAAVLAVAVVSVAAGALPVVVPVFLAALIPLAWVTVRLMVHGSPAEVFRRHRKARARAALPAGARQTALPVGTSLMLEAAPPKTIRGVVLDDAYEKEAVR